MLRVFLYHTSLEHEGLPCKKVVYWIVLATFFSCKGSIIGPGVSTIIPIVYTISGKNQDTPPSVPLATVSTIGFSGFLMGPPIIAYLAHAFGLSMALGLLVIMGAIILWLSRKLR